MFTLVNLVKMLQIEGLKLSDIVAELPEFHLAFDHVPCPWESKGRVMRQLAELHAEGQKVELVDGIKVYDGDTWSLVLPDSFEPVFHVFAESSSLVESRAIVAETRARILKLAGE